jgi:hypothetical protein
MEQAFYQNLTEQLDTISDCLERRRIIPCLCLIYSSIDVVASLERRPNEDPKAAFVRWVSDNMSKTKPLSCTPLELYAARCGILHTFTADSDLSRKGKVVRSSTPGGTPMPRILRRLRDVLAEQRLRSIWAT